MQIIGIQYRSGDFQGTHYEKVIIHGSEKIDRPEEGMGNRTESISFRKADLIDWLIDEKNIPTLLGREYTKVLYDAYKKPLMLILKQNK